MFACPVCGTAMEGGVEKCAVCGAAVTAVEELEEAHRKMAQAISGAERPAVQKRAARVPEGERRCTVCRAPLAPAAEVCLVCGTPVEEKGVRRLARPFEPEIDQETPMELPAPQEMTGEELEIPKSDSDWQGWLVQGDIYYNAGRVQKALEAYDTSLRIKESYEAYNNKGLVLYREGFFEESLKCFDRALGVHDKDEFIWFNKGNALRDIGRFQECLEARSRRRWSASSRPFASTGTTSTHGTPSAAQCSGWGGSRRPRRRLRSPSSSATITGRAGTTWPSCASSSAS
jgi:tetratricopeptide (TPR) repeat protein